MEKTYSIMVTTGGTKEQLHKLFQSLRDLNAISFFEISAYEKPVKSVVPAESEYVKVLPLTNTLDMLYGFYPRKQGKAKGLQTMINLLTKGSKVKGIGNVQLNHHQISLAIREYARKCEIEETETKYICMFDTFMNSRIYDFVSKTSEAYESGMLATYGENWQKMKFAYTDEVAVSEMEITTETDTEQLSIL